MYGNPEGRRPRGRPKVRWWNQVKADMEMMGASEEDAEDRSRWRSFVVLPRVAASSPVTYQLLENYSEPTDRLVQPQSGGDRDKSAGSGIYLEPRRTDTRASTDDENLDKRAECMDFGFGKTIVYA
ncbi:hypothetical protein J6590_099409 [Homalodisca vitripennis]|nr:hypothetical protein J6590_099409 [Homalodisca vitripennis]